MSHLESYLTYYTALDEPGYGVLVTGEWGVGKTYQVKRALSESKNFYVSLFGVDSVTALHREVLGKSQPAVKSASKIGAGGVRAASVFKKEAGALLVIPGALEVYMRWQLTKKNDHTIVFDDLERCRIAPDDLLGAISFYVEHLGFKVVVIAHDRKLDDTLKAKKEKIFGQTIKVLPDTGKALTAFVNSQPEKATRIFLLSSKQIIREAFENTKTASLRILQHSVRDLARFYTSLDPEWRDSEFFKTKLLPYVIALSLECRAGALNEDHLRGRSKWRWRGDADSDDEAEVWAVEAKARHKSAGILEEYISDKLLVDMFVNGFFDEVSINEFMKKSPHVLPPEELRPWQKVINFDDLDDGEVEAGKSKLLQEFRNRCVSDSGEMLHMFSMMLLMSSVGEYDQTGAQIEEDCVRYIDDLFAKGEITPRDQDAFWKSGEPFSGVAHNISYWVPKESEAIFKHIQKHLMDKSEEALKGHFQSKAPGLLDLMSRDPRAFMRQVSESAVGSAEYASVAILHHIAPKQFVDAWLSIDRVGWRYIKNALEKRYDRGDLSSDLSAEREWIKCVVDELKDRVDNLSGFAQFRIQRIIPRVIEIEDVEINQ